MNTSIDTEFVQIGAGDRFMHGSLCIKMAQLIGLIIQSAIKHILFSKSRTKKAKQI